MTTLLLLVALFIPPVMVTGQAHRAADDNPPVLTAAQQAECDRADFELDRKEGEQP